MEIFLNYLQSGIVFFIIFSVIILIHEGGHFWAARFGGIGIEEFGFGLPPRAWGKKNKKSGVLYSINWIPFGGFVRMLGEDDPDNKKAKKDPKAFNNRPLWARIFAVSAGVIMNFILGWLLLCIGFAVGMKPIIITPEDMDAAIMSGTVEVDSTGVYVVGVEEGSPAEKGQIEPGDFIISLENTPVATREEFLEVKEEGLNGSGYHIAIVRKDFSENPNGVMVRNFLTVITPDEEGNLGVYLSEDYPITQMHSVQYPIPEAAIMAAKETWRLSKYTVIMLGDVVKSLAQKLSIPDSVGGPVAIAQVTHMFVNNEGFIELFKLAALLSISIAVINIMPFPALDGGRLVFLLFELVTRRRPSQKIETAIHGTGFLLLMALILVVTWKDLGLPSIPAMFGLG